MSEITLVTFFKNLKILYKIRTNDTLFMVIYAQKDRDYDFLYS